MSASKQKERLKSAALIRDGKVVEGRSHYEIRSSLGDALPQTSQLMDTEGFMTTASRFVDRLDAKAVAIAAGQIHESWKRATRQLLSSDIDW